MTSDAWFKQQRLRLRLHADDLARLGYNCGVRRRLSSLMTMMMSSGSVGVFFWGLLVVLIGMAVWSSSRQVKTGGGWRWRWGKDQVETLVPRLRNEV